MQLSSKVFTSTVMNLSRVLDTLANVNYHCQHSLETAIKLNIYCINIKQVNVRSLNKCANKISDQIAGKYKRKTNMARTFYETGIHNFKNLHTCALETL